MWQVDKADAEVEIAGFEISVDIWSIQGADAAVDDTVLATRSFRTGSDRNGDSTIDIDFEDGVVSRNSSCVLVKDALQTICVCLAETVVVIALFTRLFMEA